MRHEVTGADTAIALGSGDVPVLGTPRLIAWLEAATVEAAAELLQAGETSVGTAIEVQHRAPTAVGGSVEVNVTERERDGKRLEFTVEAVDQDGTVVGAGRITRAAVDRERFVASLS
ncbi:thioesterase [Flexivirga sp. ID2601S]|uniref:Thioesterase n=1 Tax=Flexivirga aerilata TaxID=1656889 RepID=A0A849AE57_9MICO|nr:hotdog domain-containing protein [Flexivirga aerilata]NNG38073.1 thioesterase [Flexivirga aerilata]